MVDVKGLTVAIVSGTGRMGVHLSAAWAHAGMDVLMCSRDKSKAQVIVDSLKAGKGYSKGDIMVPPTPVSDTQNWKLRAGSLEDAASAQVIVLASPFHVMWPILESIAPSLRGKEKVFLDLTNPWLNTSNKDKKSPPIPLDEPQASVLVHQKRFNDPTSSWAMAYRHIFWALIHPTGPNPRTGKTTGIEVIGYEAAVNICSSMMTSHGFRPVIIPGDMKDLAPNYEIAFTGRVRKGQEGCPPPVGSGKDGLVGPFSASPMIAFDIMGEKFSRMFSRNCNKKPAAEAVAFVEAESYPGKVGKEEEYDVVPVATAVPMATAPSAGTNEIGRNVNIAKSAKIGIDVRIGQNTHIHDGAVIQDGVTIGQNCHIHMNAKVETCATMEDNSSVHMNGIVRAETTLKQGRTVSMNKTN